MTELALRRVEYVPKALESNVLYVSEKYRVAAHLCACGCGSRVVVPIGPAEWRVSERDGRPTLRPSIGSGQLPCQSHYLITNGRIDWAPSMTATQTVAKMQSDDRRREAYYRARAPKPNIFVRLWHFVLQTLGIR